MSAAVARRAHSAAPRTQSSIASGPACLTPATCGEQLAALAGTSRETCTKVLHDFADRGLLRHARGRITVLDAERLKGAAG